MTGRSIGKWGVSMGKRRLQGRNVGTFLVVQHSVIISRHHLASEHGGQLLQLLIVVAHVHRKCHGMLKLITHLIYDVLVWAGSGGETCTLHVARIHSLL